MKSRTNILDQQNKNIGMNIKGNIDKYTKY